VIFICIFSSSSSSESEDREGEVKFFFVGSFVPVRVTELMSFFNRKRKEKKKKRKIGRGGSLSHPPTKIVPSRRPYRTFVERTHPRECNGDHPIHLRRLLDHAEDQPGKYEEESSGCILTPSFNQVRSTYPNLWEFKKKEEKKKKKKLETVLSSIQSVQNKQTDKQTNNGDPVRPSDLDAQCPFMVYERSFAAR
jgi:hypothetical protein